MGQFAKVDDGDFKELSKHKWHSMWSETTQTFYAKRSFWKDGKTFKIYMHRQLLGLLAGDKRRGDHKDGDTLNNQRCNIRIVTPRQNLQNLKWHREGKLVGTSYSKQDKLWQSRIRIDGILKHLGCFQTELDAHNRYMRAVKELAESI